MRKSPTHWRYRRDIIASKEELTIDELFAWAAFGEAMTYRARNTHDTRPWWRRSLTFVGGVVLVWAFIFWSGGLIR
jgi:hypothetical protein